MTRAARMRARTAHRPIVRARRGATMAFVCIVLTALIGAAALAVDLGRMYYSAAEVQTAADAAALAAARYQQYKPLNGLAGVQAAAQQVAALNSSGGQPVQVQAGSVVPVTYNPTTRAIGPSSWTTESFAFTVTAQSAVPGIMGGVGHTVRRSATAWIANIAGGTCVRGLAINYTRFYEEGVTHDTRYTSAGTFAPDFNFWDIASTQNADLAHRTFIFLPPNEIEAHWDTLGFNSHGNWQAADLTGGGLSGFQSALGAAQGSAACSSARAAVGDVKTPIPAQTKGSAKKSNVLNAASFAMITLCNRYGTNPDAHCFDSTFKVGVKVRVMLDDSVMANGVWTMKVREVGVARVMCYFQSAQDYCNSVPMNEPPAAVGTWSSLGGKTTGYPEGTIMLLLDTPGSTNLTPDVVLGTKPGLTQRVLLAR